MHERVAELLRRRDQLWLEYFTVALGPNPFEPPEHKGRWLAHLQRTIRDNESQINSLVYQLSRAK